MKIFDNDIAHSLKVLNAGGTILYPTETIWGIGCDATNASAVKKIYRVKKREEQKSMIILLAHEHDIDRYVLHPSKKIIEFLSGREKPTTAIFEHAVNLPRQLINADGSIGIRITKDAFCKQLIDALRKPLVSTSANISSDPYPKKFDEISDAIKSGVDYIVQHRHHEIGMNQPSAIIRLNQDDEIIHLR